jgi:hypothetical protein
MSGQKINSLLGPEYSYVDLLNEKTVEIAKEAQANPVWMPLRPSAAGDCSRSLAFSWNEYLGNAKYPKEVEAPESLRLLNFGHSVEYHVLDQFQKAFSKTSFKIKHKQQQVLFFKLSTGEYVQGSIDAAFISPEHKCLIDVKSKKDKFSSWMKTSWDETDLELAENPHVVPFGKTGYWIENLPEFLSDLNDPFWLMNFIQLNLYFFDEGNFLRNLGIDHAALIYLNKNDSRMREVRFKPSQDVYEYIKEKYLTIDKVIQETKDPMQIEADYALGSIKCAFCPHNKRCWGEDTDPLRAYFKTMPEKFWSKRIENVLEPLQSELIALHEEYKTSNSHMDKAAKLEHELIATLNKAKVKKIKFDNQHVYQVQSLKTGGIKNGPRLVLRRTKD